jgi:TRAP-type C4-dicarboxylate transport system permease small subunit
MRIAALLNNFEKVLANGCLAGFAVVLALQVFYRYVLQQGLSWSEELSRFLFIWFVYISASYAVQRGTHIRVRVAVDLLPPRLASATRVLSDITWAAFNLVVVVSGVLLIRDMISHPVYSSSLIVPMAFIHAVIPVAHALMVVRIVQFYIGGRDTWGESGAPP